MQSLPNHINRDEFGSESVSELVEDLVGRDLLVAMNLHANEWPVP